MLYGAINVAGMRKEWRFTFRRPSLLGRNGWRGREGRPGREGKATWTSQNERIPLADAAVAATASGAAVQP